MDLLRSAGGTPYIVYKPIAGVINDKGLQYGKHKNVMVYISVIFLTVHGPVHYVPS